MTKNRSMKVAIVVIALTLISTCFVGTTFAKYTSSATSAASTATVAKWDIKVNGGQFAVSPTPSVTFDLFSTINDTVLVDDEIVDEEDVANARIAPGTQGSFELKIKNDSEVDATYAINYTVTNASSVPIKYSINGGSTWTNDLADVPATELAIGSDEVTINVMWKWEFNADGNNDTALGIAAQTAAPTVSVTAEITVDQVD